MVCCRLTGAWRMCTVAISLVVGAPLRVSAQRPSGCGGNTGGTCSWSSCYGWRNSQCQSGTCGCASSKCTWYSNSGDSAVCCGNGQVISGAINPVLKHNPLKYVPCKSCEGPSNCQMQGRRHLLDFARAGRSCSWCGAGKYQSGNGCVQLHAPWPLYLNQMVVRF